MRYVLLVLLAGCAVVHPWQRERLAGPTLQFEPDPGAAALERSMLEIVEGATFGGAAGGAGAGCGCH